MPDASSTAAPLDALRERGAARFDPVRFRFIEALARRAADHAGAARRVLDEKLARLISAYEADIEQEGSAAADTGCRIDAAPPPRGALADLVDRIARREPAHVAGRPAPPGVPSRTPPAELEALHYFRQTWARLSVEQRLAQSLSALPGNAGPLNSHHLVHRALTLMREVSPDYLDRFAAYTDALLWIEETRHAGARETVREPTSAPRAVAARKTPRRH